MGTVSLPLKSKAAQFAIDMLHTAMGAAIVGWLNDPAIVEIMLNPDGRLWIDRLAGGLEDTGKRLRAVQSLLDAGDVATTAAVRQITERLQMTAGRI